MANENYFSKLNSINCNDKTEKKNGLTYLSWAYAWGEVKKLFPESTYTIYKNADGWNYHTDGRTCWVETGVTINGIEHIEMLPVMDNRNRSIALEYVTSFDVNKAIQRSLTKAIGRHGLGLYIYSGEDLPEEVAGEPEPAPAPKPKRAVRKAETKPQDTTYTPLDGETYWKIIRACAEGKMAKSGKDYRTTWIEMTHADNDAILAFDQDLEAFKFGNNL